MAAALPLEMFKTLYCLVAYIAEHLCTSDTLQSIGLGLFLIDGIAFGTFGTKLEIYIVFSLLQVLALHLQGKLLRLQVSLLYVTVNPLLEVLHPLCIVETHPAEVVVAFRALHLGASVLDLLDPEAALYVRTKLGAESEKQLIESRFRYFVGLIQVVLVFLGD